MSFLAHVIAGALAASPAAVSPPDSNVVIITATEYAFEAPDTIAAGAVTFRLLNKGAQIHHAQLVKLLPGHTLEELLALMKEPGPMPAWAIEVGGPNAPAAGAEANATVMLSAGNYALICFVDVPDHAPHFTKGMSRALTVVPRTTPGFTAGPSTPPKADLSLTLFDYNFTASKPLVAGKQVIRVVNKSSQSHEVQLFKLEPNRSVQHMLQWLENPEGMAPGVGIGGVAALAKNLSAYFEVDLQPGVYGFVCFLPDAKDGNPHFLHGMTKQITVE